MSDDIRPLAARLWSISSRTTAIIMLAAGGAAAQTPPVDLSSFYHALATGVGARAWGMGGTQIALADSPEASTWNPAAAAGTDRPAAFGVLSGDRLTGDDDPAPLRAPVGAHWQHHAGADHGERRPGSTPFNSPTRCASPQASRRRRGATGGACRCPAAPMPRTSFAASRLYRFDYDYDYEASGTGGFDTIGVSVASDLGPRHPRGRDGSPLVRQPLLVVRRVVSLLGLELLRVGRLVERAASATTCGSRCPGSAWTWARSSRSRDKYFAGVVYRSGTTADVDYSNAATYEDTHTARTRLGRLTRAAARCRCRRRSGWGSPCASSLG